MGGVHINALTATGRDRRRHGLNRRRSPEDQARSVARAASAPSDSSTRASAPPATDVGPPIRPATPNDRHASFPMTATAPHRDAAPAGAALDRDGQLPAGSPPAAEPGICAAGRAHQLVLEAEHHRAGRPGGDRGGRGLRRTSRGGNTRDAGRRRRRQAAQRAEEGSGADPAAGSRVRPPAPSGDVPMTWDGSVRVSNK